MLLRIVGLHWTVEGLRRPWHHVEEGPVGAGSARAWPSHMRMEWVKNPSGEEQVWNEDHMELIAEDVTDKEVGQPVWFHQAEEEGDPNKNVRERGS